jgi:phage tail-like protein
LAGPGPWEGGSYPDLPAPGPWEGGSWPQLAQSAAPEGSSYPELSQSGPGEGSSYPSARSNTDHHGDWGFIVEIEGMEVGAFSKVEGLTVEVESIEYQHSDDITPRKRMGKIKVDNVKLVKGYVMTGDLFKWCEEAMKGDASRKSISIILLDDSRGGEAARYNLFDCWPCKWSGFKLDAKGNAALVEEIEFVVESMERA